METPHKSPCVHFVAFEDDRWWNAVRIFGKPDFIHPKWDMRAKREIGDEDIVVFAEGTEHDEPRKHNAEDYIEEWSDKRARKLERRNRKL